MGKSPHFTEQPKDAQATEDLRDTQDGVRDNGATSDREQLPEGLRRPRKGPVHSDVGRNNNDK